MSAFISVSLGMMRCACVAMPLKFKFVFTKRRTVIIVLTLLVLAVSLRVPVLTIFRIAWRQDPVTNSSIAYLAAVNRDAMSRINDVMNRGLVVWINYTIMVSCVALLSFKLSEASKIRRSCTSNRDAKSEKTTVDGLSSKDLQVIKSVVIVCVIFIFSQLPFLLYSTARLINPELTSTIVPKVICASANLRPVNTYLHYKLCIKLSEPIFGLLEQHRYDGGDATPVTIGPREKNLTNVA
ncbi:chemosensory receptor A [Elysia marginata]|uniref:Chemosensory receptor A n=1 Tax=Elysia marginata TaxID=1093978 RepID=A0AAV4HJ48_9GAST|nr:chemosensory receptor A [Elysia marginata]